MRSEFEFIHYIKKKYGLDRVGDDCAVLPKDADTDLVVTADLLVEDVDFRLQWTTPEFLGHKSLAVSLSDIAAMGADPKWAMVSIGVPESVWATDFLDRFYDGWHRLAESFGIELIGGDVSKTPGALIVDSIAAGEVRKGNAILRSEASEGDAVFVSGTLGAAAGGLRLLQSGSRYDPGQQDSSQELILRQLKPMPRVELGTLLGAGRIASSMIDVSDGISSDLRHICEQSGVGASIVYMSAEPALYSHFEPEECMQLALHGGEDFELLFTVPREQISELEDLPVRRVGTISGSVGIIELIGGESTSILEPKGYRHF